jgi:hypothetical protein
MTNINWTPFVVLGIGLLQALLLFSLRSFISNALLQLELKLGDKYVTKEELKREIDLAAKLDNVTSMLQRAGANR